MSDHDDLDEHEDDTPAIKAQREKIKRLEQDLAEANAARRENAFLKAGVDVDSKLGRLLFKSYDGELDPAAIRAEAIEAGILHDDGTGDDGGSPPPSENTGTQERRELSGGSLPPSAGLNEDVVAKGFEEFNRRLDEGATRDDVYGAVIGAIFEAARNGDPRYNLSIDG